MYSRMQEEILSRRVLIFVEGWVYWRCANSYINERLNWSPTERIFDQYSTIGLLESTNGIDEMNFSHYDAILGYYANRQLSFEGDAHRAIQGMLRKFSMLSGLRCFQGLPSPLSRSVLFSSSSAPYSRAFGRRPGFPSYSWTGWRYNPRYSTTVECARYKPRIPGEAILPDGRAGPEDSYLSSWINWQCQLIQLDR